MGLFAVVPCHASSDTTAWQPTEWNGEKSLISTSQGWQAIVSLERGRLMLFGPAGLAVNLLLAPPRPDHPDRWGGHRLWLGPQATWAKFWPPPKEWEASAPESHTVTGDLLRLVMAEAGDGWPRLTRTYHWDGPRLICGAEFHGGRRPAQFVHIFQVSAGAVVEAAAQPETAAAQGYVLLRAGDRSEPTADFERPPQVGNAGGRVILRLHEHALKPGFRPQPLVARLEAYTLTISRDAQSGKVVDAPDLGFFTQVYLSDRRSLFIELEQLSPLFSPDEPASFAVALEGRQP